jgi:hypothetical protein
MGATSQPSRLATDRIGCPKNEKARVAKSIQAAAERKKSLGEGKNERNKGDSSGFRVSLSSN